LVERNLQQQASMCHIHSNTALPDTTDTIERGMMLHPTDPRRERILLMGPANSSKSWSWLTIAKWMKETSAPGLFYVADTDLAWEGQRPLDGSLDDRIVQTDTFDYDTFEDVIQQARLKHQPGDWLVLDMVNKMWDFSQQAYFEKVFGKELDDYWLETKKAGGNIGGDYGSNWTVINKLYDALTLKIARYPGNVLACTPAQEVRQPDSKTGKGGDDRDTLLQFGRFGYKPMGQKLLAHNFHTVLLLQEVPKAGWAYSSVKDRNRPLVNGEPLEDFVKSYLVKQAGWRF